MKVPNFWSFHTPSPPPPAKRPLVLEDDTETEASVGEAVQWHKLFLLGLLGGLGLTLLLSWRDYSVTGSRAEAHTLGRRPPPAVVEETEEFVEIPAEPAEPDPPPGPGGYTLDLAAAFKEGTSSDLVRLEYPEAERLFEWIRELALEEGELEGLTFVRKESPKPGIQVFEVTAKHPGLHAEVSLERIEGRWRIVGVKGTLPEAR